MNSPQGVCPGCGVRLTQGTSYDQRRWEEEREKRKIEDFLAKTEVIKITGFYGKVLRVLYLFAVASVIIFIIGSIISGGSAGFIIIMAILLSFLALVFAALASHTPRIYKNPPSKNSAEQEHNEKAVSRASVNRFFGCVLFTGIIVLNFYMGVGNLLPQKPLEIGGSVRFGGQLWQVLDIEGDYALILMERTRIFMPYNNSDGNVTWETSDLRQYLNADYYNSLHGRERERIRETTVVNNDNPWFGTSGGNDTIDRIFLLSVEEVLRYFGNSNQIQERPQVENHNISLLRDDYNDARVSLNQQGRRVFWRLRTPGNAYNNTADIIQDGTLRLSGEGVSISIGVRPAMWISIE
jgi:hypothetical protein